MDGGTRAEARRALAGARRALAADGVVQIAAVALMRLRAETGACGGGGTAASQGGAVGPDVRADCSRGGKLDHCTDGAHVLQSGVGAGGSRQKEIREEARRIGHQPS